MEVIQTQAFAKVVKKLHRNQKEELDKAVKTIMDYNDPYKIEHLSEERFIPK